MTLATLVNMRAVEAQETAGVFAFSPYTGERYSANPADYFGAPLDDNEPLRDLEGEPMLLVFERTEYVDALSDEA
jgi:hypothetical protein